VDGDLAEIGSCFGAVRDGVDLVVAVRRGDAVVETEAEGMDVRERDVALGGDGV
jgi:hypothetical protein